MNEIVTIDKAKAIMGDNFIGTDELKKLSWIKTDDIQSISEIPFQEDELLRKRDDYLLILGIDKLSDGRELTIRNLQTIFGKDPDKAEPCFYNQDWYEKESFIDIPMNKGWYFIRRNVYEDSRAVLPTELIKLHEFPSAITCTYAFFVAWLSRGTKLWYHDFVWCSDTDHNGDRIYVGKYHDVDGINKNGFSIHRHLALRKCYGCIDWQ